MKLFLNGFLIIFAPEEAEACYWHEQSNDLNYNFRNITKKSETEFNIVELDTVHVHKYSSPSIFYYIFHIKPHFFKKIF
jgi:uncharacterized protein involved in tolerance to divalent cations